jgi:hydrogenase nickel incorporation protein HypA/HybF
MHELAVCQGLIGEVERVALAHGASGVECLTIQIGPLSGVAPELLRSAYSIARAGTVAAKADLVIEETKVRVGCTLCRAEGEATPNRLLCPSCGDWRVRVVAGEELILKSVELRRVPAPA